MANIDTIQTDFSAGELSIAAQARKDIARYAKAAKSLENVIPRTLGGLDKRAGTEYLGTTKNVEDRARLVPYIISEDEAYMLEYGDRYLRVWRTSGEQVQDPDDEGPYQLATALSEDQVQECDYAQDVDSMWFFHQVLHPRRLKFYAADDWAMAPVPFNNKPFSEQGDFPEIGLAFSDTTEGTGRTVTASDTYFLAADIGRAILFKSGIAVITARPDTTHVTVDINSEFSDSTLAAGDWNLEDSPQADLTPAVSGPVGVTTTLTLSLAGWREGDVGKFVRLNGGLLKITERTSTTVVNATIIKELTATVAAPALAWSLEDVAWSERNGYPRTGVIHDQRLCVAGTIEKPNTVWGSKSGEPTDFTLGVNDNDAFEFTLGTSGTRTNRIGYLVSARVLLALTYGGEYSLHGGVEKPITPTSVQIKSQTSHGCKNIRPLQVAAETIFVQKSGKKLRAMSFRYDEDKYKALDLGTLSSHLSSRGIAGFCFQEEPDPIIWVWLDNGEVVSITLDRDLDIVAWARHKTEGAVECMATMPSGSYEQVWMIVRREVDGEIVRYVERFQERWYPIYGTEMPDPDVFPPQDEPLNWGFMLDCALAFEDGETDEGHETWDDLGHLEGWTVHCIADGAYMGEFTVVDAAITLPRKARSVLIGLLFLPTIQLLRPEIQTALGTSSNSALSTYELWINVRNTISLTVNGEEQCPGRRIGQDALDVPPEAFTGEKKTSMLGWSRDATSQPEISQAVPLPFSLLSVTRAVTINNG